MLFRSQFYYFIPENSLNSPMKSWKHLGWCPGKDCDAALSTGDLEENKKTIVFCYKCGFRGKINKLLKEKNIKDIEDDENYSFFDIRDENKTDEILNDEFEKLQRTLNWSDEDNEPEL